MRLDEFNPEIVFAEWLFTAALGAGLGICVAGVVLALVRPRSWQLSSVGLMIGGVALSGLIGTLAVDAAPWQTVDIQLKPYLATVAEAAAMVGALALGAVVSAAVVLLALRLAWRRGLSLPLAAAGAVVVAGACLAAFLPFVNRAADPPRHPAGTDTGNTLPSVAVLEGLDIPTGLAVASNDDMLVVELPGRRVLLATRSPNGAYTIAEEIPLGLAEGDYAFHGAFHPSYPAVPVAYVVTQSTSGDVRTLQVLQLSLDGSGAHEPVITGLPTAQGRETNHHGAGLTTCGGHIFVSTSDGDSLIGRALPGTRRWEERARAQIPTSGLGQMLRWQLDGLEVTPRGVFGDTYPTFAMGLRNPFGISCDALTRNPLVADNGERGFDQVRLVEPGSNHGWPSTVERVDIVPPWFDTGRTSIAPTGIVQRAGGPDALVVSAFASQALYELTIDRDAGETTAIRLLAEVEGGAYAVAVDSGGCVYYTDVGSVYRLQEPGCE